MDASAAGAETGIFRDSNIMRVSDLAPKVAISRQAITGHEIDSAE